MVKLTEVEDEHFQQTQPGPQEDDSDAYTDTDSSLSSEEEDSDAETSHPLEETLFDRLLALKDMIPPKARNTISSTTASLTSITKSTLSFSGKAMWVLGTSVLLIGVPYGLAYIEEQQMVEMEREQRSREMGAEVLTPGAQGQLMLGQSGSSGSGSGSSEGKVQAAL
ncbi:MAG: mitochondrial import receptor protein [Cirrosporium novae-zelandiae]|nr:MAG: mitochondrial import receptor protein [Cirrosporium novae-zelandiae]